jgi:phosphate transport system protein
MLASSIKALETLDIELSEKVIEMDTAVDNYEYDVEKATAHLLALQQPMAGDLRLITASYKIAIDLERMSDFAVNIAELVKKIEGENAIPLSEITTIASITQNMLTNSIKAYSEADAELAKVTAAEDEKVDKLFYSTWEKLVKMMIDDAILIPNAVDLIFVLRYLERIADHACNICESVVYMVTNQRPNLN